MTEKAIRQIEAIKNNFNIGVEVEMNHITRENAAKLAADYFGTGQYQYLGGYYGVWSATDSQGRAWKFVYDSSIHGYSNEEKCELTTPILEYEDITVLQGLLRVLRAAGAISNPNEGCGVHIHVSRKGGFTVNAIKNLAKIMASHEGMLGKAIGISESRTSTYCQPTSDSFLRLMRTSRPHTMSALEDCWYVAHGYREEYSRTHHYNSSRYHMLNLHSFFHGHGTVEFRLWQFENPGNGKKNGLHAGQMKAMIQMSLALCQQACSVKSTSDKVRYHAHEKTSMKGFMYRLGFVGEEFKTARDFFTKGLSDEPATLARAS